MSQLIASPPPKTTPMMTQWHTCKAAAKHAVLLFRMGDFYEAFYDDAECIAKELSLTLTKRQDIPMAGIPVHTCDAYIDKLVGKGFRVAVAEQTEDPKKTKGLVKREVVRVVTPGTLVDSTLLQDKSNNFFASLHTMEGRFGLAFLDLSTGEFQAMECEETGALLSTLYRLRPSEFLLSGAFSRSQGELMDELSSSYRFLSNRIEDWQFAPQTTVPMLLEHFGVKTLDGYGLKGMSAAVGAAGALLRYLQDELCLPLQHIRQLRKASTNQYMALDQNTQRNLELTENLKDGSRRATLLSILDHTQTPMGGRLLYHWIKQPLIDVSAIAERQGACQCFLDHPDVLTHCRNHLGKVRDLERLMMKISASYAGPRDLGTLCSSLDPLPHLRQSLDALADPLLSSLAQGIEDFHSLSELLSRALVDEPPLRVSDGGMFREGYHNELDELRRLSQSSQEWLEQYQETLRETLAIKSLKVGYNRVFGYYIEVSKGQSSRMPTTYARRQTLANAERFISPELKELESKILSAEERIAELENTLYQQLREEVATYADPIFRVARVLASIDTLHSFALTAQERGYVRPTVNNDYALQIKNGRHPVIETANLSERFVPNDVDLNFDERQLLLITGPNMAGKSTYIRQVALLTIMAQMGAFLPVESAQIGICDKVFTRIGASDDLSRGQSTFMVEMTETANILNNATERSLVILDEIGRGTSTYDGISIAWAVAEYLLTTEGRRAKTLFATHYWELTRLEQELPAATNCHVAVRECDDAIIFLRKILSGNTDKSYGIHVAQLAGVPSTVLNRARSILEHLEEGRTQPQFEPPAAPQRTVLGTSVKGSSEQIQLLLFEPSTKQARPKAIVKDLEPSPLLEELRALDMDSLSPKAAYQKLLELHERSQNC